MNWWWVKRLLGPSAYDQGHREGYLEGLREGQDLGHEHGACAHSHPFDGALAAMGRKSVGHKPITARAAGWGSYNPPQASTKG